MENVREVLELLKKVDQLYERVLLGEKDILDSLDLFIVEILKYDDLSGYNEKDAHLISLAIHAFTDKVNLIYKIIDLSEDVLVTMEDLREEFNHLTMKRFDTVNRYVMGMIRVEDIEQFKECLFGFRKRLYAIQINDNNILEIAKMKSKVQHFDTEILEDEDVLKVAYANSN